MKPQPLRAIVFVAAPYARMDAIHRELGIGPLPDQPVVGYLARSTSALYDLFGGLIWVVSFDLARHRQVLRYVGAASVAFGLAILAAVWQLAGRIRSASSSQGPVPRGTGKGTSR
jgi:hypothetical protein